MAALPPTPTPSVPADFDVHAALERLGGNTVMLGQVLRSFAADLPQLPAVVADSLSTGAMHEVLRSLHTLKGLASTVGARHLAHVAAQLEERCKSALPLSEHPPIVSALQVAIDATLRELAPALVQYAAVQSEPDPSAEPSLWDAQAFRAELSALAALLESNDMQALEVYAGLRTTYRMALGPTFGSLDQAMDGLEFAKALACCQALLAA